MCFLNQENVSFTYKFGYFAPSSYLCITISEHFTMTYEQFWHPLQKRYDTGEARAVARYVLETAFGLTMTDVVCGAVERLSAAEQQQLTDMQARLLAGEPVQYVVGLADFGPRQFRVAPGVLIPRPETYEMCQWVVEACGAKSKESAARVLDIGTGSGCIACTLAADMPQAQVTACDISPIALRVASDNAQQLGVDITFKEVDILSVPCSPPFGEVGGDWDLIVSNPPYICQQEAVGMEPHVLGHEPHLALFVPDDNPLLYYRAIAHFARHALHHGGMLFFEINPLYVDEMRLMMAEQEFKDVEVRKDQFGNWRMMKGIKE